MTDVIVRKNHNDKPAALAAEPRWEPMRLMRELAQWDPFREMSPLFASQGLAVFSPSFEVKENKDGYTFRADVPGVKESDLDISVSGNRLTISGKREAERREKDETYYAYERSYGEFSRAFTLPDGVDHDSLHAELKDGVLNVAVAKSAAARPRKIAVQSGKKS